MLLRISDATLLRDLRAHFLRSGFDVEDAGGTTIGVSERDDPSLELELQEIELHLEAWQASHPGVKVERVGLIVEHRAGLREKGHRADR